MSFLNTITAHFLILTLRWHLFRIRLVIFNISCNSLADLASKAISSINNKHMRITKPYWTPTSVALSSTFSSSISSPNYGPERGLPWLKLSSITIVSVRPNFFITVISWLLSAKVFLWFLLSITGRKYPPDIYLFKVKNGNTRKRCKICSWLTIRITERHH